MIPDKSTPIKNEILINIFAKGLLSKEEMRIIFYIIRWSWGFNGVKRRQDWTKELTKRQISDGIEMCESHLNENINRMIIENKIIIKDRCYQFNEHYEEWKNLPKREVSNYNKLTEKGNKTYRKGKLSLPKREVEFTEKGSSTDLKPLQDKPLPDRKETLKETKTKETKRILSQTFGEFDQIYQLTIYLEGKIMENNKAVNKREKYQIQSWCKDMDYLVRIDKAKPEDIKKIIDWVVQDKFWAKNILCPASLRKQYPRFYKEVISESINDPNRFDFIDEEENLIE